MGATAQASAFASPRGGSAERGLLDGAGARQSGSVRPGQPLPKGSAVRGRRVPNPTDVSVLEDIVYPSGRGPDDGKHLPASFLGNLGNQRKTILGG